MIKSLPFCNKTTIRWKKEKIIWSTVQNWATLCDFLSTVNFLFTLALAGGECDLRRRAHESRHLVKVIGDTTREEVSCSGETKGEHQKRSKDSGEWTAFSEAYLSSSGWEIKTWNLKIKSLLLTKSVHIGFSWKFHRSSFSGNQSVSFIQYAAMCENSSWNPSKKSSGV